MVSRLCGKLRRVWNWVQGKRIMVTDPGRGRVKIRTGRNSANRRDGGQWYLQRYETAHGQPPLPRCSRGSLQDPVTLLGAQRFDGEELARARRWYEAKHGSLRDGQELTLVCVYDPTESTTDSPVMPYTPCEVFEVEHPWLSSEHRGPSFTTYFGTWYGSGLLDEEDVMDFEIFCDVHPGWKPFPRWGATWR